MNQEQVEIIQDVFAEVMEKIAFMFAEPAEKDAVSSEDSEYIQAMMSFTGDLSGSISIAVPVEMCPEIASNILGISPEEEQGMELATDALKEVLNISCGQILTAIGSEKMDFSLTVPETRTMDAREWDRSLNQDNILAFSVDDFPVLLGLTINS